MSVRVAAVLLSLVLTAGCVKAHTLSYRPPGSRAAAWHVKVVRDGSTFSVVINGSTVIKKSAKLFENNVDATGKYKRRTVRLRVRQEFQVFRGNHWAAQVFVNRELVGTADL